ncbi:hypothetical protein LEP1GSC188_0804 [Leptospira weilii serovar Topaz str. LT2116]|uniref:Uncharacterized protein n=1 Tax=Leptospira weilii serovar Topaz str. LT2116 TaxID=1088540 RepID=M3GYQ6_9LEPT|nr:hypothetical protein LEP1GSC188_0804 [Leptospira weilii serovar Topaz str. LT2116]
MKSYGEIIFLQGAIRNPDVLKKILHEFSDKKDTDILFKEFATFYSEQEYDKRHFSFFVGSPNSKALLKPVQA